MSDKETIIKIQMLDKLKNEVLVKYLNDVDTDQEIDLYDKLIEHFISGELDNIYENSQLKDMNSEEKKKVLEVIHKYQNVIFYEKNPEYWLDSIDAVPVTDYNLITYLLLDNFDFLINLYLKTNEESLKILVDYDKCIFYEKRLSIVENVKRSFVNKEVLFRVFFELTKEDSLYHIFTDNEIRTLINYSEGTLYYYENNDIKVNDPLSLVTQIYSNMNTNPLNLDDNNQALEFLQNFFLNEDGFDEAVEEIYYDYQETILSNNLGVSELENDFI